MTTISDEVAPRRRRKRQAAAPLPPLTPANIKRASEGLAAARDPKTRRSVTEALTNAELLVEGHADRHLDGWLRQRILRIFVHTLFQVRIDFAERIPTGPVILAPNHLNHIDPFLILSEVPGKPFYHIIGDSRTLYNRLWKRMLLRLAGGVLPLDRVWGEERAVMEGARKGRQDLAELAAAIEKDVPDGTSIENLRRLDRIVQGIFNHGDGLLIFPEGALGQVEGDLKAPLKRGTVIYAMRAHVPIVPVGLIGTRDLYLGKELQVRFGEPLHYAYSSHPHANDVQEGVDRLEAALRDLIDIDYEEEHVEHQPLRRLLNRMFW